MEKPLTYVCLFVGVGLEAGAGKIGTVGMWATVGQHVTFIWSFPFFPIPTCRRSEHYYSG